MTGSAAVFLNTIWPGVTGGRKWLVAAVMVVVAGLVPLVPAQAAEPPHAVVLMYHRFGETALPSTNVRLEQIDAHIEELKNGDFTVWPLKRIVEHIRSGQSMPDRTIGISIDDAYASVYKEAWPRFRAAGFPFTVFVSTDQVGRSANYMTWDQIREMRDAGVLVGHHGAAHGHMADTSPAAMKSDLDRASASFRKELGKVPALFAYPYGEASLALRNLVRTSGFTAAFGQHSGVANTSDDLFYLPRFALNEAYGDMGRFRLAVNALPLPARDISPGNMLLSQNPPAYGFTIDGPLSGLSRLNCFASHLATPVKTEQLGPNRIEVRFDQPFPAGRSRINCTLRDKSGRWRWLGRLFYVPETN